MRTHPPSGTSRWRCLALFTAGAATWAACADPPPPTQAPEDLGQPDAQEDAAQDMAPDTAAPDLPAPDMEEEVFGAVPLDAQSPWPKFRVNAAQTGRTARALTDDGAPRWVFPTGKGIFSSPIVGADGTVYIGSADRNFYALRPDGSERWRFATGEIIDSAALLDDLGRVYFGSGDGFLYALNAQSGAEVWKMQADDPAQNSAFIRWFEGNVAIGVDGTLYAPNDNFFVYGVNRDNGLVRFRARMPDQTWSLPAVDVEDGRLYIGNNNVIPQLGNAFAFDRRGEQLWKQSSKGTISASPLLPGNGTLILGGFDGYVRALYQDNGAVRWEYATRDHVYASPALLPDGGVVQPSADGTVYNLDVNTGALRWAFDWGAPIRSSPAIDGEDHIYVGTGDGHLLVLNGDGTMRWALRLIRDDRDDLNASPALGEHAIYIAGESGEVFGIPYDFCLRPEEAQNPDCLLGPDEPLPADGVFLRYTSRFGSELVEAPAQVDANAPIALSLSVRQGGRSVLALLDEESLEVTTTPPARLRVEISGNRRFLTIVPEADFTATLAGTLTVQVRGSYLINPARDGLKTEGGERGGDFDERFVFTLRQPEVEDAGLVIPQAPGEPATLLEMTRLAAPLPTLLPSYNQIGFDSLTYHVGFVEGSPERAIGWLVEAAADERGGPSAPKPGTRGVFPFIITAQGGLLTLNNQEGLTLEVLNAVISFKSFRVSTHLGPEGALNEPATVYATTICGDIPLYGFFLQELGLCNPQTDSLTAYGAVLLNRHPDSPQAAPANIGEVTLTATPQSLRAQISGSPLSVDNYSLSLLVLDAADGTPVPLRYGPTTQVEANQNGLLSAITLPLPANVELPRRLRVYLMVNTSPAWRAEIDRP